MATVIYRRETGTGLSSEQLDEVRQAAAQPITYDEDAPKLTAKELMEFHRVHTERDDRLFALKPLMEVLVDDAWVIEDDLTDEELAILDEGHKHYLAHPEDFVPLDSLR